MTLPLTCSCGHIAPAGAWACPRRGVDDGDHVLQLPQPTEWAVDDGQHNPFLRYRHMLFVHAEAMAAGIDDDEYCAIVTALDDRIEAVDERRLVVSPTAPAPGIGALVEADVWLKDETHTVSGSHKARHVAGLMIGLLTGERSGALTSRPRLAIASCGNAALAASVMAAAADWPITVFVPPDGDAWVLDRLDSLGAEVVRCPRDGEAGDPTYRAFRQAVAEGAVPFGCQGPDNGRTIDGGRTLGWELAEQVRALDRVIVQVGGAALASGVFQGLATAAAVGVLDRAPVCDTLQTEGCAPLARALVRTRALSGLDKARARRSEVMWPWEQTPHSIATGILDDETYDWASAVEAMLSSGGEALVVGDDLIAEANELVRAHTDLTPSFTGSAGVAGLLARHRAGDLTPGERVACLITGIGAP
ncbi:MAG: pyridoxal-phosphate dependent enzyme [Acidimicrobiia bacterium]|nr:pyridoxal-phosphate dependent enzyme [Acidimicrobiia bacterium]